MPINSISSKNKDNKYIYTHINMKNTNTHNNKNNLSQNKFQNMNNMGTSPKFKKNFNKSIPLYIIKKNSNNKDTAKDSKSPLSLTRRIETFKNIKVKEIKKKSSNKLIKKPNNIINHQHSKSVNNNNKDFNFKFSKINHFNTTKNINPKKDNSNFGILSFSTTNISTNNIDNNNNYINKNNNLNLCMDYISNINMNNNNNKNNKNEESKNKNYFHNKSAEQTKRNIKSKDNINKKPNIEKNNNNEKNILKGDIKNFDKFFINNILCKNILDLKDEQKEKNPEELHFSIVNIIQNVNKIKNKF